jgi:hypothetical protein
MKTGLLPLIYTECIYPVRHRDRKASFSASNRAKGLTHDVVELFLAGDLGDRHGLFCVSLVERVAGGDSDSCLWGETCKLFYRRLHPVCDDNHSPERLNQQRGEAPDLTFPSVQIDSFSQLLYQRARHPVYR